MPASRLGWARARTTRPATARGSRPATPRASARANTDPRAASVLLRLRHERQDDAVDAIAEAARGRSVLEYVTQVSAAPAAVHFRPRHEVAAVHRRRHCTFERRK